MMRILSQEEKQRRAHNIARWAYEHWGDVETFRRLTERSYDQEVQEAIALYKHLKNHSEVKNADMYKGEPMCSLCKKTAFQIWKDGFREEMKKSGVLVEEEEVCQEKQC